MSSHYLGRQASHDTFMSLLELEPAPIESPPFPAHDDADKPILFRRDESGDDHSTAAGSSMTGTSLGLSAKGSSSSSSHGAIYYLTRIQRYSSYLIPLFTTIHLTNTSLIPLLARSVPASETYLLQARELYQTSLSEPLLVTLPIAAHVLSGIALRLVRRSHNLKRYGGSTPSMWALHRARAAISSSPESRDAVAAAAAAEMEHELKHSGHTHSNRSLRIWPPLSWISISGYVFAASLAAHVVMNRVLPILVEGDSSNIGLGYVSHGFARHPLPAWSAYIVLLAAGCGHMVWGAARWAGIAPVAMGWRGLGTRVEDKAVRRMRRRAWWAVQGVVVALAGLWAAGGLGVVARGGLADGWVGKVYDSVYDAFFVPL